MLPVVCQSANWPATSCRRLAIWENLGRDPNCRTPLDIHTSLLSLPVTGAPGIRMSMRHLQVSNHQITCWISLQWLMQSV